MTINEQKQYYLDLIELKRKELNEINVEWIEFCRKNKIINEFTCTPEGIIESVCSKFKIQKNNIKGRTRRHKFLYPRYVAIYLIWIEFNHKRYDNKTREKKDGFLSLADISKFFSLDHSTIINARDKMIDMVENNRTNSLLADYWNDYNERDITI